MSKRKYYTIYLNSTDEIIASGTAIECAGKLNKSLNCFYSLVSKNQLKHINKYTVYSEPLEDSDSFSSDSD